MAKIRFYFDESVNVAIGAGLVRRGVYAITAKEAGNLRLADIEQLEYAAQHGFVIVTHDDDFLSIAVRKMHSGIIYSHQEKYTVGDFVRRLKLLWDVLGSEDMENHIEFL